MIDNKLLWLSCIAIIGIPFIAAAEMSQDLDGHTRIVKTADDLRIDKEGSIIFSAWQQGGNRYLKNTSIKERKDSCYERSGMDFSVISVVGPLIFIDSNEWIGKDGGVLWPGNERKVIDTTRPEQQITLLDYFHEGDVLNALRADKIVRRAAEKCSIELDNIITLDALFKRFDDNGLKQCPIELPDCSVRFNQNILQQFDFHHLSSAKVAVRLLMQGYGSCDSAELGLYLPIPQVLKSDLERSQQKGWLAGQEHLAPYHISYTYIERFGKNTPDGCEPDVND